MRREERRPDEGRRDESRRDETRADEMRADETRGDETTGGGVCSSVLDSNPRSVGVEGSGRGGWGSINFLRFGGIFEFPVSF